MSIGRAGSKRLQGLVLRHHFIGALARLFARLGEKEVPAFLVEGLDLGDGAPHVRFRIGREHFDGDLPEGHGLLQVELLEFRLLLERDLEDFPAAGLEGDLLGDGLLGVRGVLNGEGHRGHGRLELDGEAGAGHGIQDGRGVGLAVHHHVERPRVVHNDALAGNDLGIAAGDRACPARRSASTRGRPGRFEFLHLLGVRGLEGGRK